MSEDKWEEKCRRIKVSPSPLEKRVMSDAPREDRGREAHAATVRAAWTALDGVTFLPASPDKRFHRQMSGRTDLTSRQFDYLRWLVHRYRRQLGEDFAMRLGAGLKAIQDAGEYDEP